MKHILLILLVVTSIGGFGQKKDTLVSKWTDATNATWGNGLTFTRVSTYTKTDTIKVLMLVCDTTQYPNDTKLYFRQSDQMIHEGKLTWWQYGYEVKEKVVTDEWTTIAPSMVGQYLTYWKHKEYLDQNKKPLPSSIVVWMTKEIKN